MPLRKVRKTRKQLWFEKPRLTDRELIMLVVVMVVMVLSVWLGLIIGMT